MISNMSAKTVDECEQQLATSKQTGLSSKEASDRLMKNGPNQLAEQKPKTPVQMFFEQLNDPMIYILIIAAIISVVLKEISDAIIILIVILINAIVGLIQEGKAQKALDALKKLSSPIALVKRDGKVFEIPAAELVEGDIVVLEAGRQIPADLRLSATTNLKIEESALTGESVPVDKNCDLLCDEKVSLGDKLNMAFMSTNVSYGRGEGIVVATGMNTEIGKIATMLESSKDEMTPLQKRLAELSKLLGALCVILCVALFVIALIQDRDVIEMLITAISLAVAAVPEGLAAIVTIVLAIGVQRLVKVNTIVRKLPSVETLGCVSVVCSDKTGTLTQNRMTVVKFVYDNEYHAIEELDPVKHDLILKGFMLCSDASIANDQRLGDPTEIALLDIAAKYNLHKETLEKTMPRINEQAFDSDRKMMTTVHQAETGTISFTKGAADQILKHCTRILDHGKERAIVDADRDAIQLHVKTMSQSALRVLGLAIRKDSSDAKEEDLTFVGLYGMIDPARPEAKDAVAVFKQASVKTVMITGDHVDTALAIAKDLGIASDRSQCMTGDDIDSLSDEELVQKVDNLCVFARVSPEHKVRIVNAFRATGKVVSMTGDGVNDAPSLKAADIGVAMGITGTDVAKGAADMILTDDNFATIEKAIAEGRGIYANIKKSVLFLLSSNFGEVITMFVSILAGFAAPLKAIHILWVNLITDTLPGLALGVDENDQSDVMKVPPRDPKESLFAHGGLSLTIFYGFIISLITLGGFLAAPINSIHAAGGQLTLTSIKAALDNPEILKLAQTYAFTILGISQLFHAIGMRNIDNSIFSKVYHTKNRLMIFAFIIGFLLQISVTEIDILCDVFGTVQLSAKEWIFLTLTTSIPLWFHEIIVLIRRAAHQHA